MQEITSCMELQRVLQHLGLEEKEAKTYLTLLSLGEATAARLAEKTSLDRTLMYQLTNKLIEKGIVSYIIKNNVRYFLAADPEVLLKNLQEKEELFKKVLPELKAKQKEIVTETKVELYRGREGIKTILKMAMRDQKPYYIMGGAQEACSLFALENKVFVINAEKLKIHGKILARKKDKFFIGKYEEYKFIPDSLISSTTMMLWGNKTAIFVWSEPYYSVLIENNNVTKTNMATFTYLWSMGEKPSAKDAKQRMII